MTEVRSVAIIGLGLMGGSLAKGLRAMPAGPYVQAWTAAGDEPAAALAAGAIDAAPATLADTLRDVDLVVLATPVGASIDLLPDIMRVLPSHVVITDVCSVKAPLMAAAAASGHARYVGSHPMAGSESSGWNAARADLYRDAVVYLTPAATVDHDAVATVRRLWTGLGAHPESIDAHEHDALMARVSHVPQIVASALGATLAASGIPVERLGPGGRDATRLAGSDPDLWTDLLLHSGAALEALNEVRATLDRVAGALERPDAPALHRVLAEASRWRRAGA